MRIVVERRRPRGRVVRVAAAVMLLGIATAGCLSPAPPPAGFGTVQVAGSQWLAGLGVDVFSNGNAGYCCGPTSYYGVVAVGTQWQCVELAQRLYTELGWYRGIFLGVHEARDIYFSAGALGMEAHPNGSGYLPVPGDLIVLDAPAGGGAGHVSVVDSSTTGRVSVVEQNFGPGRGVYQLDGSTLSRDGFAVLGTVHSPADPLR